MKPDDSVKVTMWGSVIWVNEKDQQISVRPYANPHAAGITIRLDDADTSVEPHFPQPQVGDLIEAAEQFNRLPPGSIVCPDGTEDDGKTSLWYPMYKELNGAWWGNGSMRVPHELGGPIRVLRVGLAP